jgi:very-short-patch-repair endonuclease
MPKLPPYQRLKKTSSRGQWRSPSTTEEQILAKALEAEGFKVKQNPRICGFYPDIYIRGTRLLIEVDGGYHKTAETKLRDKQRTAILKQHGFRVLRFSNNYVKTRLESAIAKVVKTLQAMYGKKK